MLHYELTKDIVSMFICIAHNVCVYVDGHVMLSKRVNINNHDLPRVQKDFSKINFVWTTAANKSLNIKNIFRSHIKCIKDFFFFLFLYSSDLFNQVLHIIARLQYRHIYNGIRPLKDIFIFWCQRHTGHRIFRHIL